MPTQHPRISVVRDPELGAALSESAPRLAGRTQAARLRELALIGARSLGVADGELPAARRALDDLGATRERSDLLAISRRLREGVASGESVSDSLDWVRGPR